MTMGCGVDLFPACGQSRGRIAQHNNCRWIGSPRFPKFDPLARFLHKKAAMNRQKILIVEDESDVRRLYAIGLNQHGFEVKLAANGAEAVERVAMEKPDVILLDWRMPLMDGREVLSRLQDGNGSIPIIVISGQPAPAGRLDPRIRRWLTKPVTIEDLVDEIEGPLTAANL
jgi:CheY-like chemotaxis protein